MVGALPEILHDGLFLGLGPARKSHGKQRAAGQRQRERPSARETPRKRAATARPGIGAR